MEHDLGHVLGFEHTDFGVLAATLAAGTRRAPTPLDPAKDWAPVDGFSGTTRTVPGVNLRGSEVLFALLGRAHQRRGGW